MCYLLLLVQELLNHFFVVNILSYVANSDERPSAYVVFIRNIPLLIGLRFNFQPSKKAYGNS